MKDITDRIRALADRLGVAILAHNYCNPEVQEIAGYFGDSLELARSGVAIDAKAILLCGVKFMAETVSILNPDKTVLMPDVTAGCPMADMAGAAAVSRLRLKYPDAVFVSYVNTSVEIKAISDVCCTSSSALDIVGQIPSDRRVVFLPDRNLGSWVAEQTGREMILWDGWCPSHNRITPEQIAAAKRAHPEAEVLVHPECRPSVREMADYVMGTKAMLDWATASSATAFIVGTEIGLLHRLSKLRPDARFVGIEPPIVCPNMKKTTLDNVLFCLESYESGDYGRHEVTVDAEVARKAVTALNRMIGRLPVC